MARVVAGMASWTVGSGSSSTRPPRGQPQESVASYNSYIGYNGDKSDTRKVNGTQVSGTQDAFNVKGNGSTIVVADGSINSGYCAGYAEVDMHARQNLPFVGCSGTNNAFNVDEGAKIIVLGGSINSGACSGYRVQQ